MKYWAVLNSHDNTDLVIIAGPKINAIKHIFKREQENMVKSYAYFDSEDSLRYLKKDIEKIFNLLQNKQYTKAYNIYNRFVDELYDCDEYEIYETKVVTSINYNVPSEFLNKLITFQ